jgi:RNA polymerase sigma-70 factor, ECF subfamily
MHFAGFGSRRVWYCMSFRLTGPAILAVWRSPSALVPGAKRERLEEEVVALFDQLRDPLLRYLLSFGIGMEDGEDLIQEVFLVLFQHLNRGKSRENLRGWLFRVAHNLALKRRSRTRREFLGRTEPGAGELAIDPNPSPEAQVVNGQTQQRLLAVVEALPEQDRRCLFLRAEGLRYREIAGVLDMSLGAVSLSLARSLARIARVAER